LGDLFF